MGPTEDFLQQLEQRQPRAMATSLDWAGRPQWPHLLLWLHDHQAPAPLLQEWDPRQAELGAQAPGAHCLQQGRAAPHSQLPPAPDTPP